MRAGPERKPRYLVADQQALDLLEKSVHRTPLISPSAHGPKTRFLKLPPAQVCNKVLSSAAREPKLVARWVTAGSGGGGCGWLAGLQNKVLQENAIEPVKAASCCNFRMSPLARAGHCRGYKWLVTLRG